MFPSSYSYINMSNKEKHNIRWRNIVRTDVLSLEHQNRDFSSSYTVNWISPSSEHGLEMLELN